MNLLILITQAAMLIQLLPTKWKGRGSLQEKRERKGKISQRQIFASLHSNNAQAVLFKYKFHEIFLSLELKLCGCSEK
jgi:hypothetical protein